MVIYLAFFGLIILIAAAVVVLGSPVAEEGVSAEKPDPALKLQSNTKTERQKP